MIRYVSLATLSIPLIILAESGVTAADELPDGTFQCGEQTVQADFRDESVRLMVGNETFDLRQVPAASGARYEARDDPSTSFWSRGDHALLDIRGESYPECTPVTGEQQSFRATGNEPPWLLEIGPEELSLLLDYGQTRITAPAPVGEPDDGLVRYLAEDIGLTVTVLYRYCTDSMSGMPHPNTVVLVHDGEELTGCGGKPASLLRGIEWVVGRIGDAEPVEDSRVTLEFGDQDRISGNASCNRYMGAYTLTGESLSFGPLATTMMACEEPLMEQEEKFLALLEEVYRFELDADGGLILRAAADEQAITAHRPDQ